MLDKIWDNNEDADYLIEKINKIGDIFSNELENIKIVSCKKPFNCSRIPIKNQVAGAPPTQEYVEQTYNCDGEGPFTIEQAKVFIQSSKYNSNKKKDCDRYGINGGELSKLLNRVNEQLELNNDEQKRIDKIKQDVTQNMLKFIQSNTFRMSRTESPPLETQHTQHTHTTTTTTHTHTTSTHTHTHTQHTHTHNHNQHNTQ